MTESLGSGAPGLAGRTTAGAVVPRATYRLQLHKGFPFASAAAVAPYLAQLGISHVYLSPILMARAGSTHGYDVVDHTRINPELGGEDGFRTMARAYREHGLAIIADIVPNHMAVGGADNPLWLDILEHGETSRYASWFDIDWHPATIGLDGKLLVPFLSESYGHALRHDVLELQHDTATGKFAVWAYEHHKLPLSPETAANLTPADVPRLKADKAALDALIQRQHWRIAQNSVGDEEINYRRFFIVSDLAGIRVERPEVFAHVHRLTFGLIAEGLIDGLRIDHVDGLYDPAAYCRQLRAAAPRPIYLVAEKILAEDEGLPADWGIDGTTGYEFASLVTPLLVDPAGEAELTRFHAEFTGVTEAPAEIEHAGKLRVMDHELAAELEALSWRFARLANTAADPRDITRGQLKAALRDFAAAMPTYRTYAGANGVSDEDRFVITAALAEAARSKPGPAGMALAFVGRVMTAEIPGSAALDLAMRVQQFTGPVMAKGLEDTALYRTNRLIALNDVGERPARFSLTLDTFHAAVARRALSQPYSLLATTTHDTKRGEDARCRIAAISSRATEWTASVPGWLMLIYEAGAPKIAADDAYHVLQLLIGSWPSQPSVAFSERLTSAMVKSVREARLRSSWLNPDHEYEERLGQFIRTALDPVAGQLFRSSFATLEAKLGLAGALNGLVATTLKLTLPGVPDIYQGAELWEQSMVDPDNRRPVDFAAHAARLAANADNPLEEMLPHWRDASIKQALIARLLSVRSLHPALFLSGSYEPVPLEGTAVTNICAFLRRHEDIALLVAVRLYPGRATQRAVRVDQLCLPKGLPGRKWQSALGLPNSNGALFSALPASVLLAAA
jgi:(1->4)-alpha-D-glucan 1-alpha-D-glucosylmutase